MITSDTVINAMPVAGFYEKSMTMHNGHSTWESTLDNMVMFKGTCGVWQFGQTAEDKTENDDTDDCPSGTQWALSTFSIQINSQDGMFLSS